MAQVRMRIPVFLPGNSRDWTEINGVATINEEGDVHVQLQKEHAMALAEMAKNGQIIALSFDYLEEKATSTNG